MRSNLKASVPIEKSQFTPTQAPCAYVNDWDCNGIVYISTALSTKSFAVAKAGHLASRCVSVILYADDILLLSPSRYNSYINF